MVSKKMLTHTIKITSKGQITIPKEVRDFLNTDMVTFEIKDDQVLMKPLDKVGGILKAYQKDISFKEARSLAWNGVARDHQS